MMRSSLVPVLLAGSLVPLFFLQGCDGVNVVDPHCEDPNSPGYMKDPACLEEMIDAGSDSSDSGDDGSADSG